MKFLACLLFLAAPAFCDTLYTFSGSSGFSYDATTGAFPDGTIVTLPVTGETAVALPNWAWDIYYISFEPTVANNMDSTEMELDMIDNDGSYEPITAWYTIFGFRAGDFGTYAALNNDPIGDTAEYGLPNDLTLNVTDPPANAVPEPTTFALVALVGIVGFCLRLGKLAFQRK